MVNGYVVNVGSNLARLNVCVPPILWPYDHHDLIMFLYMKTIMKNILDIYNGNITTMIMIIDLLYHPKMISI